MPPTYMAVIGRILSRAPATSSVSCRERPVKISKPSGRPPRLFQPRSSDTEWDSELSAIGSHPSPISAHSSVFFGPPDASHSGWAQRRAGSSGGPCPDRASRVRGTGGRSPGRRRRPGLPVEHLADDGQVVTQSFRWMAPRLAVPSLDDLRAGDSDPDDDPSPTRQRINRHRLHGQGGRWPCGELDHCRAQLDPSGISGEIRQRRQGISPVRLGGPH